MAARRWESGSWGTVGIGGNPSTAVDVQAPTNRRERLPAGRPLLSMSALSGPRLALGVTLTVAR
jgi:hypothetical protein